MPNDTKRKKPPGIALIGAGVILALAVAAAIVFWPLDEQGAMMGAPAVPKPLPPPAELVVPDLIPNRPSAPIDAPTNSIDEAPADVAQKPPAPAAEPLPALDDSDAFVRTQVAQLGFPDSWVDSDDLVRRFAVLIANLGNGEAPPKRFSILSPRERFPVRQEGDRFFLDPAGYARYSSYVDQLERVDPKIVAAFVHLLRPLLNEALLELGQPGDVGEMASAAIDQVLKTQAVQGDIELVQPKVLFQFADPELESLNGLQKQVLRMGPDNAKRLQAYLLRLRPLLS